MHFSNKRFKTVYIIFMIQLLSMALYNVFYGLSDFPILSWDEARHGVSAYEMLKRGNLLVNTYRSHIDYWNLKPPLSFWTTMIGYKIAGFNALGLRLFSALSSFLTIIMVAVFVLKRHGMIASFISTLSLATSTQFLINHSSRTGDADSLYVFLFTAAMLAMLQGEKNLRWLYIMGIAFSFAFLTKSWHAGNILVIFSFYLLLTGLYKQFSLRNWTFLIVSLSLPIFLWVFLRFQYDGISFFKSMVSYDLLKRSSSSIEGHIGTSTFYFEVLWRFSKFWIFFLICITPIFLYQNLSINFFKRTNWFYAAGILLWLSIPFILYSLAETKIRWYILPIYPVLSIIIGAMTGSILQASKQILRFALVPTILYCSLMYESEIVTFINHPTPIFHVSLLQKLAGYERIKGYSLYKYHKAKMVKWPQNAILAAELYGDLHVKNGDFEDFLQNNRGLLLIKEGKNAKQIIDSNQLSVIASNEWGYIVCKKDILSRIR
jgi:4-amino-4-deoxy-L-arabinose transferase-like glycosyltransferase